MSGKWRGVGFREEFEDSTSARPSTNGTKSGSMVTVMRLRENLRSYVADLNAETAATGMWMVLDTTAVIV